MSVFRPMSTSGSPDRKKALLDRLMEQYQEAAGRSAGLGSLAGAGGSTPFHMSHPFGGMGLHVGQPHGLPPELMARLGPGGIGIPQPPHIGGPEQPHAGGGPAAAGGPGHPIGVAPPSAPSLSGPAASGPTDGYVGPLSAAASGGTQNPLGITTGHLEQIVQRIARMRSAGGVYSSPFHSGIGTI